MVQRSMSRASLARRYARRFLETDPGIRTIYYFEGPPESEIRLLVVNELMAERTEDPIRPLDFGVDTGTTTAHKLIVADVTPKQLDKIKEEKLRLPQDWSFESSKVLFERP